MRKKPMIDIDKYGYKDKQRIDKRLKQITDNESKKKYLQMCIDVYCKLSNKLITKKERDHYMMVQRYCEKLHKGIL